MPEFNQNELHQETETKHGRHCFWGVHRYQIIDTREITNNRGDEVGRIYIQQCCDCGKIHSTNIRLYEF